MSSLLDAARRLANHPNWDWRQGMLDQRGGRLVGGSWEHPTVEASGAPPNLNDGATAGILLQILDETGLLTDVVKHRGDWVVAIDRGDGPIGYAGDSLGEAAAWALLAVWGEDIARPSLAAG